MSRIICFDTETTGFDYAKGDRIIEIGAIEIIDGRITENSFHEYINPYGKIIPPAVYMVHKISNEFLTDKPKMSVVAPKLLDFIGDSPVVAHNGFDFDFPFMNYELRALGLDEIPRERQQDSIVIARHKIFGPKEYTLDALAKWFNISLSARSDAHGALIDAEILAKVFLELSRADDANTTAEIVEKQHDDFLSTPKLGASFPNRTFTPTAEELAIHEAFVQKIKK